jgi:hypothetical protein
MRGRRFDGNLEAALARRTGYLIRLVILSTIGLGVA